MSSRDIGRKSHSRSISPSRHKDRDYRDRSPHREHRRHHHHRHHHHRPSAHTAEDAAPPVLPYNSRPLSKRDYTAFRPMFALYLDIQKQKSLDNMDEVEAKGRWKSFIGKWNRGELAEGWYDPSTLQRAIANAQADGPDERTKDDSRDGGRRPSPSRGNAGREGRDGESALRGRDEPRDDGGNDSEDSDDSLGPAPPGEEHVRRSKRAGPSIPGREDLELKRELDQEDRALAREDQRHAYKAERKAAKERLEELVPRADPGSRERRLEKKAETNAMMRQFRDPSPGGAVPDSELLGGADDGADLKKLKQEQERKKNERELRREEVQRARAAEREERLEEYRKKEEGTMEMLRRIARERFGGGEGGAV